MACPIDQRAKAHRVGKIVQFCNSQSMMLAIPINDGLHPILIRHEPGRPGRWGLTRNEQETDIKNRWSPTSPFPIKECHISRKGEQGIARMKIVVNDHLRQWFTWLNALNSGKQCLIASVEMFGGALLYAIELRHSVSEFPCWQHFSLRDLVPARREV